MRTHVDQYVQAFTARDARMTQALDTGDNVRREHLVNFVASLGEKSFFRDTVMVGGRVRPLKPRLLWRSDFLSHSVGQNHSMRLLAVTPQLVWACVELCQSKTLELLTLMTKYMSMTSSLAIDVRSLGWITSSRTPLLFIDTCATGSTSSAPSGRRFKA